MAKQSISCYQPSGFNSTFRNNVSDFQSYIEQAKEMILSGRVDLTATNQELVIAANQPEQYLSTNKRVGILLIHGLFYSPFIMKSMFQHFQQKNILTRSLLLPGHGTVPGDLLEVTYQDWINATAFAIDSFKQEVEHLVVIATSTGALVAMHQALMKKNISGLILFAPALTIKNRLAWLAPTLAPHMKWVSKQQETDYSHYLSITTNCVAQVHLLAKEIKSLLKKQSIDIPQFLIASLDDEVISTSEVLNYFQNHYSEKNFLLIYGNQKLNLPFNNYEQRNSFYPEKNIISFSHTCLTVSPLHPHYGECGDYHDRHIYRTWYGQWFYHFIKNKPQMRGATLFHNLYRYNMQRLSFNPDFENMMKKIDDFMRVALGLND